MTCEGSDQIQDTLSQNTLVLASSLHSDFLLTIELRVGADPGADVAWCRCTGTVSWRGWAWSVSNCIMAAEDGCDSETLSSN